MPTNLNRTTMFLRKLNHAMDRLLIMAALSIGIEVLWPWFTPDGFNPARVIFRTFFAFTIASLAYRANNGRWLP